MKRILALHGHSQSAHVFSRKVDFLRQALKDEVEFVFIDAPHVLVPVDPQNPYEITPTSTAVVDKFTPRCWWKYLCSTYDEWAVIESLLYLKDVLEKEGPFNGIMGFSQGGALATLISGLLEYPTYNPYFSNVNHPPFEFLLCFSGFLIPSENFAAPSGMRTPTLLVQGDNDTLVLPEWITYLHDRFDKDAGNVRVETHEGGHFIPHKPSWKSFLTKYISDFASRPAPVYSTTFNKLVASSSTDSLESYYSSAASSFGGNDASSETSFSDASSASKVKGVSVSVHSVEPFEGGSTCSSPFYMASRPETPERRHEVFEPLSVLDSPTISAALANTSPHKPVPLYEIDHFVLQSAYKDEKEASTFNVDIERGLALDSESEHSSIDIPGIACRRPKVVKRIPSSYLRSATTALL